ncbi:hypothetical protein [Larkinella rosea]|uniref:Uncharacterized protein n=1 Tax=Larkinella rosea TaxID=2025312 RepID=A0A3P1BZ83_9BACT|nr:hypothetical protein [Larkinella rosea]RRB06377.1 hypothetical protein EHT25_00805 [Larkinella rosea]
MDLFNVKIPTLGKVTITPENEKLQEGMRRAVQHVIEKTKKKDEELVIARNGKPVRVKARDL